MKKKRLAHLGVALALAAFLAGCGSNKNLQPYSELVLHGADPPTLNISVSPPLDHQTYFVFTVKLSEANMSMIPADAWTVDGYQLTYSLISDPGHHLQSLPGEVHKSLHVQVKPGPATRLPVVMTSADYLRDSAQGLVGTSDTATIKAHVTFRAHRNKDGASQSMDARVLFTLGTF